MEAVDQIGFYKISDIIQTNGSTREPILPISRSTWLRGIKEGIFPEPHKLMGINVWAKKDVLALLGRIGEGAANDP